MMHIRIQQIYQMSLLIVQAKLLEDLEQSIEKGKDFKLSVRRRESVLDGGAANREAIYELNFRSAPLRA